MNLHNIGNPDRKEVKVMPQIILCVWKIIFSGSLLHKTPTPWENHGSMARGSHGTHLFTLIPPCFSARAPAQHQGGGGQRAGRRGGLARPRPAQRRDHPVQRVCQVQYSTVQYPLIYCPHHAIC